MLAVKINYKDCGVVTQRGRTTLTLPL